MRDRWAVESDGGKRIRTAPARGYGSFAWPLGVRGFPLLGCTDEFCCPLLAETLPSTPCSLWTCALPRR